MPHKRYGSVTVVLYGRGVAGKAHTPPASAPPPPRRTPPQPHAHQKTAPPPPPHRAHPPAHRPGGPAGAKAKAGRDDEVVPIAKISESADKTSYTAELGAIAPSDRAGAQLVKKGAFVVLRCGGHEKRWCVPFAVREVSSLSARWRDAAEPGQPQTLVLTIKKEPVAGPESEAVAEGLLVPADPGVEQRTRPQVRLRSTTAERVEAYLNGSWVDVRVGVKLLHQEPARSLLRFEYLFHEPTPAGPIKPLRGNQTVRLPYPCAAADVAAEVKDGVLVVSAKPPRPAPYDPALPEQPIPIS